MTTNAAFRLRPDGESFFNDKDMQLYVGCNSGRSRHAPAEGLQQARAIRRPFSYQALIAAHVHLACIDDVTYNDEPSDAALTHAPKGRDALLILAFLKENPYHCQLTEERAALTSIPSRQQALLQHSIPVESSCCRTVGP